MPLNSSVSRVPQDLLPTEITSHHEFGQRMFAGAE